MITCPRCGFEQPVDRFCAKCGIVMENYKAKRSFLKRVNSPTLAFILVLIGTVGLILLVLANRDRVSEFRANPITQTNVPPGDAEAPVSNQTVQNFPPGSQALQAPSPATPAANESAATGTAGAAAPDGTAARTEGSRMAPSVLIEFMLVSREALEKLAQVSDGRIEIGRYSVAAIPQYKTRIENLGQGFQNLASESRGLTTGSPSLVFRGGKEPKSNEEIGFFIEVTPVRQSERAGEYKISMKRSLPEFTPTGEIRVQTQNVDEMVILAHGSALAVGGLLPRKPLVEGEDALYRTNILKAFLEPAFQRGDEEFVVFISPQINPVASE
jgi:hypothetical protein